MFYSKKEWLDYFNPEATSDFKLYMATLYHAAISFAGVDISPRTKLELFSFAVLLLFNSIFNAIIYGEFGVLQEQSGAASREFQKRYDNSVSAMNELAKQGRDIGSDNYSAIIKFVRSTHYLMK
jgi:hypothetical protein